MPSLSEAITAAALLMLFSQIHAQDAAPTREYWVSIASFEEFENAEIAQQQASGKLTERLSITPATTPSGYVLRVVAGPYFDRPMAEQVLESSRAAGYDTAWIFSQEVPPLATTGGVEDVTAQDTYSPSAPSASDTSAGYSTSTSVPSVRPDSEPPPEESARTDSVLVREAPADYSVHRLYRN